MIKFLHHYGFKFNAKVETSIDKTEHECLFAEVDSDDDIDEYIIKYQCQKYIFIIKNTNRYADYIVDNIYDATVVEIYQFNVVDMLHDI